jgi:acetolactate synthase-1/2/3 large subunit
MARDAFRYTTQLIRESKRPILIVGNGARGSDYMALNLPIITTRLGIDLIDSDHPLFIGRPGLVSDRVSHIAIQNADLIIAVGARLDTGIIGYEPDDWGRNAKKVVVDVDMKELMKPGIKAEKINMDSKTFIDGVKKYNNHNDYREWLTMIKDWKKKYPLQETGSYGHLKTISDLADKDDIIVVDTSSSFHVAAQVWRVKQGQIYITTGGISTMGYWPAAMGAYMASGRRTICVTGDGCFQMNIQELATVVKHQMNIKIFLLNNSGYLLIRNTQKTHCGNRLIGEGKDSGLGFPNFRMVADAYDIAYTTNIRLALKMDGPVLCEIKTPYWEKMEPRIASKKNEDGSFSNRPYEDLEPTI